MIRVTNTVNRIEPIIATNAPITFPISVAGTTSPYPTVVTVITDHHNASENEWIAPSFDFSICKISNAEEIIKIAVSHVMGQQGDPRLQSFIPINQSIPDQQQQQGATGAQQRRKQE